MGSIKKGIKNILVDLFEAGVIIVGILIAAGVVAGLYTVLEYLQ